jgi:hypothetical protein
MLRACMRRMRAYVHSGFVCIPTMLFKSRNRSQIETKYKTSMLFLDLNFMFISMVHLFLLVVQYYVQEKG